MGIIARKFRKFLLEKSPNITKKLLEDCRICALDTKSISEVSEVHYSVNNLCKLFTFKFENREYSLSYSYGNSDNLLLNDLDMYDTNPVVSVEGFAQYFI